MPYDRGGTTPSVDSLPPQHSPRLPLPRPALPRAPGLPLSIPGSTTRGMPRRPCRRRQLAVAKPLLHSASGTARRIGRETGDSFFQIGLFAASTTILVRATYSR